MLMLLGARIHTALIDLAFAIAPGLVTGDPQGRRRHPWLGMLVVLLLVAGLAFVGEVGIWAVHEAAPHRETQP